MTSRRDLVARGTLKGEQALRDLAQGLHEGRLATGLSQASVGRAVGISPSGVSRIERGHVRRLPIVTAGRLAGVVGLDLVLNLYPGRGHIRDETQVRLLHRMRVRLGVAWRWMYEVPLPKGLDQRAWDAWAIHERSHVAFALDAESRIHDSQSILRRLALKRRDGDPPRLILLVNDTRRNRLAIDLAADSFGAAFPADPRRALASLVDGDDPGADALICL